MKYEAKNLVGLNYDYVLTAADKFEQAAHKIRSVYILTMTPAERDRFLAEARLEIAVASHLLSQFKQ